MTEENREDEQIENLGGNRNLIKIGPLPPKMKEEFQESKFLSDAEIKQKLERYRGRIPSVLLRDVYDAVKGRKITDDQLVRILEKVESRFKEASGVNVNDIYAKIDRLEKMLEKTIRSQEQQSLEGVQEATQPSSESQFEDQVHSEAPESVSEVHPETQLKESPEVKGLETLSTVKLKETPKTTKGIMFMLKWIEYLIERVGYEGLEDALNYYVDIGWISEDVMFDVMRYARGIRLYHQNADWRPVGYLNVQDHLMSLLFIEALRTGKFSKELMLAVEREIYRMKKEVSELHGI
jgi:flagellar protein FlaD